MSENVAAMSNVQASPLPRKGKGKKALNKTTKVSPAILENTLDAALPNSPSRSIEKTLPAEEMPSLITHQVPEALLEGEVAVLSQTTKVSPAMVESTLDAVVPNGPSQNIETTPSMEMTSLITPQVQEALLKGETVVLSPNTFLLVADDFPPNESEVLRRSKARDKAHPESIVSCIYRDCIENKIGANVFLRGHFLSDLTRCTLIPLVCDNVQLMTKLFGFRYVIDSFSHADHAESLTNVTEFAFDIQSRQMILAEIRPSAPASFRQTKRRMFKLFDEVLVGNPDPNLFDQTDLGSTFPWMKHLGEGYLTSLKKEQRSKAFGFKTLCEHLEGLGMEAEIRSTIWRVCIGILFLLSDDFANAARVMKLDEADLHSCTDVVSVADVIYRELFAWVVFRMNQNLENHLSIASTRSEEVLTIRVAEIGGFDMTGHFSDLPSTQHAQEFSLVDAFKRASEFGSSVEFDVVSALQKQCLPEFFFYHVDRDHVRENAWSNGLAIPLIKFTKDVLTSRFSAVAAEGAFQDQLDKASARKSFCIPEAQLTAMEVDELAIRVQSLLCLDISALDLNLLDNIFDRTWFVSKRINLSQDQNVSLEQWILSLEALRQRVQQERAIESIVSALSASDGVVPAIDLLIRATEERWIAGALGKLRTELLSRLVEARESLDSAVCGKVLGRFGSTPIATFANDPELSDAIKSVTGIAAYVDGFARAKLSNEMQAIFQSNNHRQATKRFCETVAAAPMASTMYKLQAAPSTAAAPGEKSRSFLGKSVKTIARSMASRVSVVSLNNNRSQTISFQEQHWYKDCFQSALSFLQKENMSSLSLGVIHVQLCKAINEWAENSESFLDFEVRRQVILAAMEQVGSFDFTHIETKDESRDAIARLAFPAVVLFTLDLCNLGDEGKSKYEQLALSLEIFLRTVGARLPKDAADLLRDFVYGLDDMFAEFEVVKRTNMFLTLGLVSRIWARFASLESLQPKPVVLAVQVDQAVEEAPLPAPPPVKLTEKEKREEEWRKNYVPCKVLFDYADPDGEEGYLNVQAGEFVWMPVAGCSGKSAINETRTWIYVERYCEDLDNPPRNQDGSFMRMKGYVPFSYVGFPGFE